MLPVFLTSYLIALLTAPAAIRVAHRTGFLDHPERYKSHAKPTPYLGGAVVLTAFLAGGLVHLAVEESHFLPIFVGAAFLWAVGTADDRVILGPRVRVIAEVLVAILLWRTGLGWSLFAGDAADLIVTIVWVVGVVNAFNLMDNMDGATGTVAAVSAAGIALLAVQNGPESLAALAVAVTGGCIGFLHYNLTRPARIFLGDGGSMLLGFLIAALSMAVWREARLDGVDIVAAILLAGLPILDMTLVIVSRTRRGIPLATGGRDHLTYRLFSTLGSTWAVAGALAVAQGALCLVAVELVGWDREWVLVAAAVTFVLGLIAIAILEMPTFRKYLDANDSEADPAEDAPDSGHPGLAVDQRLPVPRPGEL